MQPKSAIRLQGWQNVEGLKDRNLISANQDTQHAERQRDILQKWAASLMEVLKVAGMYEDVWLLFTWLRGSNIALGEQLYEASMIALAGSGDVERLLTARQLALATLGGKTALQRHTWLHWPVIASAYTARLPDILWREMDWACRSFADNPKKLAIVLGSTLQYVQPEDARLAENLLARAAKWNMRTNWHITAAMINIYVANRQPEKALSFLQYAADWKRESNQNTTVMAQSFSIIGKLCCHNEDQMTVVLMLAETMPSFKPIGTLKLCRIACAAHHGRVEEAMAQLEDMRSSYKQLRTSLNLVQLFSELGGWYLDPARQYATWLLAILEQRDENLSLITCEIAQHRRAESRQWDNLCRILEFHIGKPPVEAYTVLWEACAREKKPEVALELLGWAAEDGLQLSLCDWLSVLASQPLRKRSMLVKKALKMYQDPITEQDLLEAMQRCSNLPEPSWKEIVFDASVWREPAQSTRDMVLSARPLPREAEVCLEVLAPAAQHPHSPALLQKYLHVCEACGDWQNAVLMLRKYILKAFGSTIASRQAFETAFGILMAARQTTALVDLFKFGHEQGVLKTRLANFELTGEAVLQDVPPNTAYAMYLNWIFLAKANKEYIAVRLQDKETLQIVTGTSSKLQASMRAFTASLQPQLSLRCSEDVIFINVPHFTSWLSIVDLPS